ncbi:MAG: hypothetical protein EBT55_03550 [Proteobacteria bacterium]|nr:hypothetical protein [Pseudomonadota bacterium]
MILSKTGYEKNQIFSSKASKAENTIIAMHHIITKQCNGAQSFVLCAKPDSPKSPMYAYSKTRWEVKNSRGEITFSPSGSLYFSSEDYEIKQSAIHEALKSLIESGSSF